MGARVATQCSRNRCLAQWTVWVPIAAAEAQQVERTRRKTCSRAESEFLCPSASCTATCLSDAFPGWSPSGKRIVFQRSLGPSVGENNVIALVLMRADGATLVLHRVEAEPTPETPSTLRRHLEASVLRASF
jgi:hypothetical protein